MEPTSTSTPTPMPMPAPAAAPASWINRLFHRQPQNNDDKPNETSSLLIPKPPPPSTPSSSSHPSWLPEFLHLIKTSIPIIFAYTLQNSLQTTSVLIVGRLSPSHLSASAFSYMFAMSTAWLLGLGGTTALDTLGSSSHTGSRDPHILGILLQRAFLVLTIFYLPVATLWWFSEPLFLVLGQTPELSSDACRFLRVLIPGGLGYIFFEAVKKFLQAQGLARAGTYVLLICAPLCALLNYLCVYTLDMGLLGAPLATGVTYWLAFLLLVCYARFVAGGDAWGHGFSRRALSARHLATFARLAALGIIMVGTEWWAFEIVALVAGHLGRTPLAAQSVIMTTDQVLNTIPFGIGVAVSTRVGHKLGLRNPNGAAHAARVGAWTSIAAGAAVGAALMAVRGTYGKLFSDDEKVVRLVADVMPWVAAFQVADGLNGSCGGALRGMGRQHVGAGVNLVAYYGAALPAGVWLALWMGWGLEGLWVGQCVALYCVGGAMWVLVGRSRWAVQVQGAFARMEEGVDVDVDE